MEDAQVQGEDANPPRERGDNSTRGPNFPSPSDIYSRLLHLEEQQCNLVQQFTAFRDETRNQFDHIAMSLQTLTNSFLVYPPPPPPQP